MASRFWQPNHEPPYRKGKQAPITLNKREGRGGENCLDNELPQCCKFTLKAQARIPQRKYT